MAVLAALSAMTGTGVVSAGTATASMPIQAIVDNGCLVSAPPLVFGSYLAGGGPLKGNTTISVQCTNGTRYGVGLAVGTTAGASYAQRLMANGARTLQYNLYTSGTYATVWGDGSGTTQIVSGLSTGFGTPVTLTVYGLLPDSAANQIAVPGNYSDSILVVLTY
jgi:spore coat protein U-like protein